MGLYSGIGWISGIQPGYTGLALPAVQARVQAYFPYVQAYIRTVHIRVWACMCIYGLHPGLAVYRVQARIHVYTAYVRACIWTCTRIWAVYPMYRPTPWISGYEAYPQIQACISL